MASLNGLVWLQRAINRTRVGFYNRFWGMSLHPTVRLSLTAKLDRTYPRGVHIGGYSYVAFGAAVLTHDMTRGVRRNTVIGRNCFIGARSILLPGVRIGDGSIVAAGAVVTRDVPPASVVAGNPAVVLRSDITVGPYGRFPDADAIQAADTARNSGAVADRTPG